MSAAHPVPFGSTARGPADTAPAERGNDSQVSADRPTRRRTREQANRAQLAPAPSDVAMAAAVAAAGRVGAFLQERSRSSMLDPDEVTAVFTGGDWLVLDHQDLLVLCRYVEAHAADVPGPDTSTDASDADPGTNTLTGEQASATDGGPDDPIADGPAAVGNRGASGSGTVT